MPPDAEVIDFPSSNVRLCWACLERPCRDEPKAWGLCIECLIETL